MDNNHLPTCPDRETLGNILIDGSDVAETLKCHIDLCRDCQSTLEELSNLQSLDPLRHHARRGTDFSHGLEPAKTADDLGSIGKLAIESLIGRGGMGDVFRGRDEKLGRIVAVKILARGSSPQSEARFVREAHALARLDHPNIVPVYSTGRLADGRPWLSMPFVDGKSLKERIENQELDARIAATIVQKVCDALAAAHESGLLHRDIKPANILLDLKSDSPRLADFGLARTIDGETLTRADVLCGTPEYMSPEQVIDTTAFDQRSDVYSLGITLYESLTGTPPFRGQPVQVLEQHRRSEPIPPGTLRPSVPLDLQNVCLMAIAKEPERRYQTAREFSADLQRFLTGRPVRARETTSLERLWLWCKRNPAVAGLSATSVVLLVLLATGSSIAAWRLNQANKQLALEKQNVEAAEKMAVNDRNAAIDSLHNLVGSVYRDLTDDAASIRTREHVANAAIQGLKSLTELKGDRPTDKSFFQAHLHLADLSSLKGDLSNAQSNYELAIDNATQMVNHDPDNALATLALATAVGKFATHLFRQADARAVATTDRSIDLLDSLIAKNVNSPEVRTTWLLMQGQRLELIRRKEPSNADAVIQPGKEILAERDSSSTLPENDSKLIHALARINFIVARSLLESNHAVDSLRYFDESRKLLHQVLAHTPNNVQVLAESAVLDRGLGMAAGAQGKLAKATRLFESALATQVRLSDADTDDLAQKVQVANTRSILAMAYHYAGDFDRAIEQINQTISEYQAVVASNPGDQSTQSLIVDQRFKLAELQMLSDRWGDARQTIASAASELAGLNDSQQLEAIVATHRKRLSLSEEVLSKLEGDTPATNTAKGDWYALYWIGRRDAFHATSFNLSDSARDLATAINPEFAGDTFQELFDFIYKLDGVVPDSSLIRTMHEARVFGILASRLPDSQLAEKEQLAEQALQRCLSAIKKIATAMPDAFADIVLNDSDLIPIRKTEEFAAFWGEIKVVSDGLE